MKIINRTFVVLNELRIRKACYMPENSKYRAKRERLTRQILRSLSYTEHLLCSELMKVCPESAKR